MSSEQQLNVDISVVDDELCHSKQSQYRDKCSVENVIPADVMLENETITNGNATNDEIGQNLKVNENHKQSAIEENVNVPSEQDIGNEVSYQENAQSDEKYSLANNDHVERENVNSNLENGHGTVSSAVNNEAIHVSEDKSGTVDLQSTHETAPQSVNVDQATSSQSEISNEKRTLHLTPGTTENEIAESCVQQENSELTEEPPVAASHTNNQPLGSVNESNVDDNEIVQNDDDDASNEENDNFSNEQDSNDGISDVADDDGTTEVENDEYILDTVLRKPRKERRRIVSVNDDSDPENDVERELLLQSPTLEQNELTDIEGAEEDIERLIQNEKPGPKSKKVSTQKLKELQARELLRNAVVIPSSKKKKKSRIIDSEDDEEPLPYCVDVDDIGLPDTTEDNDNENDIDAMVGSSILLNDVNDMDKASTSSIENLIENYSPDVSNVLEKNIKAEPEDEKKPVVLQCSADIKCSGESSREIENQSSEAVLSVKEEPFVAAENETGTLCDSGNSTDSTNQQSTKEEENRSTNVDFPPFSSSSSSENGDEFIPNEIYFGTPDHNSKRSSRGKGQRTRGRPTQSPREKKTVQNVARPIRKGRGGGRPSRLENFIDNRRTSSTSCSVSGTSSSDSDDEYQKSKARRKPATITIVKQPSQLYHKGNLPVRRQHQPQKIQRPKHRQQDRFYDKSQDIPNAIYFGDVDVPLHVLHAYGDSDSDNAANTRITAAKFDALSSKQARFLTQVSRGQGRVMALPNQLVQLHNDSKHTPTTARSLSDSRKVRGRQKVPSVSPSNDQSIQMMKKCLKAAGLKRVKLNRLWEGCKSNSERADKMLDLLREKGLEGEPTIAKCRQLKVDYLTKREIEDLDPNLIIQTEGRTRRSTRAATKRQYTYDEEEILETRTKLRKVIDSDSDFE